MIKNLLNRFKRVFSKKEDPNLIKVSGALQSFPHLCKFWYWAISKNFKVDAFDNQVVEVVYIDEDRNVFRLGDQKVYRLEDFIWLSYHFDAPRELEDIVKALRRAQV